MPTPILFDREITSTEAIVRVLADAGVDTLFGMSGGDTGRIFSRLAHHTDLIRTVLVRNEAHATSAAESYARATGGVGVAMGQGTWIVGQGIVGILEAQASGTPLVLLSDLTDGRPYAQHAPYQSGTGDYGNWDARQAFAAVTKRVFVATTPAEAVQSVQLAVKHALTGQPGPVAVLFSSASLAGTVGPDSVPRLYATAAYLPHPTSTAPEVGALVDGLRTAQAPVILAGGGVRLGRAADRLRAVAEATGAAVVTTPSGKGTFPEDHVQAGGVFGNFGTTVANDLLGAADVVVVLGSKLGPSDTANEAPGIIDPTRQRLVQVDIEPLHASWTMPTSDVVVADVGAALDAVLGALTAEPLPERTVAARTAAIAERLSGVASVESSQAASDSVPIHPQRAIAELRAALPDDVIITCDAGENRLLMSRYFTSRASGDYLQPAGAGGMGYAIPAAIGAKTAHPDRTVVAVCGDGGFSMSLPALLTATEEDLPIVVVVLNNGILGWVQHSQRARGELEFKSTLHRFDYAGFAEAAGFTAWRVSDPADLGGALRDAVALRKPAIVVAEVSTEQTFIDLRTPHLVGAAPTRS